MNVEELIQQFPNDADLGRAIRQAFPNKTKHLDTFLQFKKLKSGDIIHVYLKNGKVLVTTLVENITDGNQLNTEYKTIGYEEIKFIDIIEFPPKD